MPLIFSQNTGRVVAINDQVAAGSLSLVSLVGNTRVNYRVHNSIFTRMGISESGNFQFLHTIANDVYMYVFGDRMGQVVLDGISFAGKCAVNGGTAAQFDPGIYNFRHGIEEMLDWYEQNRLSARKDPVIVTVGRSKAFAGFITSLTASVEDPVYRKVNFQLTVTLLPDAVV
jgi:hypothetical protein